MLSTRDEVITLFIKNNSVTLSDRTPVSHTLVVEVNAEDTIEYLCSLLLAKDRENYPATYNNVTLAELREDIRFSYAGKTIYGSSEATIGKLNWSSYSTLTETRSFGNPRSQFTIGKERREFDALYKKDADAAMLRFACFFQVPKHNNDDSYAVTKRQSGSYMDPA